MRERSTELRAGAVPLPEMEHVNVSGYAHHSFPELTAWLRAGLAVRHTLPAQVPNREQYTGRVLCTRW